MEKYLKMKVVDRIRIFEVLEAGQKQRSYAPGILGLQRPQIKGNERCPYLFLSSDVNTGGMNFHIESGHAKQICTMVITKIKK